MFCKNPSANFNLILFFLFLTFTTSNLEAQQKAFPSAYGGGAYASGGRGGNVYHVTRIDDSFTNGRPTPGTFRWATKQARPATIVFDVSGIIELKSNLYIEDNDLTIAGQTAPEGGITITKKDPNIMFMLTKGSNIIMRYIRIRPQDVSKDDAFEFYSDTQGGFNTIFDHMSISYGSDEAFSIRGRETRNITFQRGLIAESKTGSLFGDTDPDNGGAFSYNNSFFTTLFVNISHRTPNVSGNGRFDIVNNVIYNWNNRLSNISSGAKVNHINNYYFLGNKKSVSYSYKGLTYYEMNCGNTSLNTLNIHTSGNIVQNFFTDARADNRAMWVRYDSGAQHTLLSSSYFKDDRYPLVGAKLPIMSAVYASKNVPEDSGANKFLNPDGTYGIFRDPNDTDYVRMVQTDKPESYVANESGHSYLTGQRFAKFVKAANNASAINSRPDKFYVSNAHIPEAFVKTYMLKGQDHNDLAPSGYTWLEEYLNGVDKINTVIKVSGVTVSPKSADLSIKETLQLTATLTPKNANNKKGTWRSSNKKIASVDSNGLVTPVSVGEVDILFNSDDGGFEEQVKIKVFAQTFKTSAGGEQQICRGSTTTLTATGGATYLWSTGARTTSIEVSPEKTTTYSVTAYDRSNKNSEVTQVKVTVNTPPVVDAGINVTIDPGETTTLTARGATSYRWSTGETTASIKVSPSYSQPYTVTGITNGCEAIDIVDVWVRNTQTRTTKVSAGEDQSICLGSTTTLTAAGGVTYLWSTGARTTSIEVSPAKTTTYSVTGYDSSGKNPESTQVKVIVNSPPKVDAGINVTIDPGEITVLIARGATSYRWNTGETTASIKVSPSYSQPYTVTGFTNGCEAIDIVDVWVRNTQPRTTKISAGQDQSICLGSSARLSATGGVTYLWSTGARSESIDVYPSINTTYSVTAYDSSGKNIETAQVKVIVNSPPTVDAGLNVTIDPGEATILTATGATSYRWSTGETKASIKVSPSYSQPYTVTGFTNGCEAIDIVDVWVRNTKSSVARVSGGEDQSICLGTSTTLNATGGVTYLWSTGARTANIEVSPSINTTYSVTAYDSSGKNPETAQVKVIVNSPPTVDAGLNVTIDPGEATILTATGATAYRWSTGETTASIKVSPSYSQSYTVTGFTNGCEAIDIVDVWVRNTKSSLARGNSRVDQSSQKDLTSKEEFSVRIENIKINQKTLLPVKFTGNNTEGKVPIAKNNSKSESTNAGYNVRLCRNDKIILTAIGTDNCEYLWSTGETTKSITVNPLFNTEYSLTAFNASHSSTDVILVTVENCMTSIEAGKRTTDFEVRDFSIYPNPTRGELNINISGLSNVTSIGLYDLSGKSLYYETIKKSGRSSYSKTLNLSAYKSGIYLLRLIDNERVITKKIVLK